MANVEAETVVENVDTPCTIFANTVVFWLINTYFMILYIYIYNVRVYVKVKAVKLAVRHGLVCTRTPCIETGL